MLLNFENSGYNVPEHMWTGIENYIVHGFLPGSFMEAILCNDFFSAVCRADSINSKHLPDIGFWILQNLPGHSYGSPEIINNWAKDENNIRSDYVKYLKSKKFHEVMTNE